MIENTKWIKPEKDYKDVVPAFIKKFNCKEKPVKATLCITAAGVYEANINGARVGRFIMAPGLTDYTKRYPYQTYDVTDMLSDENIIEVLVALGWLRARFWSETQFTSLPPALKCELVIKYSDGTFGTISCDETWKCSESPVRYSHIYHGIVYDANVAPDTGVCAAVMTDEFSMLDLYSQDGEDVIETQIIDAVDIINTPNGETVVDFGQNLTGYVAFDIDAKKGDKVSYVHGEVLDSEGNFYNANYRSAKALVDYTCRDGKQSFKPMGTFFGFRYIKLNEFPGKPQKEQFKAIVVHSNLKRTGDFKSSNAMLNKLYENSVWSQRDNFLDIPTDCPQRNERLGWTGDAQVFCTTAAYNYDVHRFFKKWLTDVRLCQKDDGSLSSTIPCFMHDNITNSGWSDAITIIPWKMYVFYGDKDALASQYPSMCAWVDHIKNITEEYPLFVGGHQFGDWLGLDSEPGSYHGATDDVLVSTAFYAHSVSNVIKAGKVLGCDVSEYERIYTDIVKAFRERFDGKYNTQTGCVLALHFGLTAEPEKTADTLERLILDNGCALTTGFLGAPYLLHALSENGKADIAYRLLLRTEYPSWLYPVTKGATTIWEHWDGIKPDGSFWSTDMNSFNHYAYGSVFDWVYGVACGIRLNEDAPAFSHPVIAPVATDRIESMSASLDTRSGKIVSSWRHDENGKIIYEITLPCDGTVIVNGETKELSAGSYTF